MESDNIWGSYVDKRFFFLPVQPIDTQTINLKQCIFYHGLKVINVFGHPLKSATYVFQSVSWLVGQLVGLSHEVAKMSNKFILIKKVAFFYKNTNTIFVNDRRKWSVRRYAEQLIHDINKALYQLINIHIYINVSVSPKGVQLPLKQMFLMLSL